jgi:hypothetical protein
MKVAVTFDRVGEILDSSGGRGSTARKSFLWDGTRKARRPLPELFPVEEQLGGDGQTQGVDQEGAGDGVSDRLPQQQF